MDDLKKRADKQKERADTAKADLKPDASYEQKDEAKRSLGEYHRLLEIWKKEKAYWEKTPLDAALIAKLEKAANAAKMQLEKCREDS